MKGSNLSTVVFPAKVENLLSVEEVECQLWFTLGDFMVF